MCKRKGETSDYRWACFPEQHESIYVCGTQRLKYCLHEHVMIDYNNVNNAHYAAINGQNLRQYIIWHRLVLSYTHENHILIFDFDIFIYIYSVRGEIVQISANTFGYGICCAANVYIFVYICNRARVEQHV